MGFELNKCCFCVDLRTGSLIIGYLSLVMSLVMTLLSALGLIALGALMANKDKLDPEDQEKAMAAASIAMILTAIVLVFQIINLIFVIVLLVGLHQEKRGHVKAYLIYNTIYLVLTVIFFIVGVAMGNGEIVRNLISIGLGIYFLVVIRSHYVKMDESAKRPAMYNTA